jgi:hypothetical protein
MEYLEVANAICGDDWSTLREKTVGLRNEATLRIQIKRRIRVARTCRYPAIHLVRVTTVIKARLCAKEAREEGPLGDRITSSIR